jgi:NADP-dependent aldehyde dehydrogenase
LPLTGELLIGGRAVPGAAGEVRAYNPATGETLEPAFGGASAADLDRACALAAEAFDVYRATSLEGRARFLEAVADNIADVGDALIERAMQETGLPRARLEGERGRTMGQLRLFASVVREGSWLGVRIDPALPERTPAPRPDLRLRHIPLGPVAVFGASNFPLAFSVAGGDTAAALAAGCPVVVKAHPAHPGTSELVGRAVQTAVSDCGLPPGVFALLHDQGLAISQALAAEPRIKALAFTGSRAAGLALSAIAQARPEPIPVYAEMSSINPVLLMPGALAARAESIATGFIASLNLGAGQFCTNPGLVLALAGPDLDRFLAAAGLALSGATPGVMLTRGIHAAYAKGLAELEGHPEVTVHGRGLEGGLNQGRPALFVVEAAAFRADRALHREVFGAASMVVRCRDLAELAAVLDSLEGQLTAAVHLEAVDVDAVRPLLPILERKAGRLLVNGFGTGVEVAHAMVHGGPFPATSDSRTTSVGSLAIQRFLRPVCYQDVPEALLPPELKADNPLGLWRRVDGELSRS